MRWGLTFGGGYMEIYSVRNGLREPVKKWAFILPEHSTLLLRCCMEYLDSIAHYAPKHIPGTKYIERLDEEKFFMYIKSQIPDLQGENWRYGNLNQDSLLDFIEFISYHCRDYEEKTVEYTHEEYLIFLDASTIFNDFRSDINEIFEKCGVLFTLSDNKQIERIIPVSVVSEDIDKSIHEIQEVELQNLLCEAIELFKNRNEEINKLSVEKIWDALERLKTYYLDLDKSKSANKIIEDMSGGRDEFKELFETEFKTLTQMGNNFRIRHHETNKVDIVDYKHYDYFFNRCLSLIALAIQYLK